MATTKYASAAIVWESRANDINGRAVEAVTEDEIGYSVLRFDCVASEAHEASNNVTSYPVATGFVVSDHAVRVNRQLSLDGIVANTVLDGSVKGSLYNGLAGLGATAIGAVSGGLGALLAEASFLIEDEDTSEDKVRNAFRVLNHLVQSGTIVHVSTILGQYENCVIRQIKTVQDATSSAYLPIQLVIEEMNVIGVDPATTVNARAVLKGLKNDNNLSKMLASQAVNLTAILAKQAGVGTLNPTDILSEVSS